MKSFILITFLRVLAIFPLFVVRMMGSFMGHVAWILSSRMVETSKINLELCYPEEDKTKIRLLARNSILHTFQTMTECGPAWLWPTEKVMEQVIAVEGLEILKQAHEGGKGAVVLAPHLGNWEVFGLYLNNCGCGQSSQLYQAPKNKQLDKLIYNARSRAGANMVATNNKGVALLLKSLKNGEIVGILPDQVPPESGGEYAPLFGKDVLTMTLVSRLIQKTGARAVMGFAARVKIGNRTGWKIIFRKPDSEIYAEHIIESLTAMNSSIAKLVNEYPEQYQWEYKRFKRLPPGETRPY